MEAGLEMLLKHMPDVIIDIPLVEDYVAPLIAHLLADGHVQESILQSMATLSGPQMGASIKGKVEQVIELPLPLTTMKHKVLLALSPLSLLSPSHSHSLIAPPPLPHPPLFLLLPTHPSHAWSLCLVLA